MASDEASAPSTISQAGTLTPWISWYVPYLVRVSRFSAVIASCMRLARNAANAGSLCWNAAYPSP